MTNLILVTNARGNSIDILPALSLLNHQVKIMPAEPSALINAPICDAVLVDARKDLPAAKSLCRLIRTTGITAPLIAITTEGGLIAITSDWGIDEVLLENAGPAEVDARIRLVISRLKGNDDSVNPEIERGDLVIDESAYSVKIKGQLIDLTFKEFELLKFLAQHPGRVFSRQQLLQEVWGFDYFGGTRTVDVHVRRLRAKLGPEYENFISTLRNVGYKFISSRDLKDSTPVDEEVNNRING
ncbi:MAG: winged-helix domain-containing protein [Actinomycetes bacterium]